MVCLIKTFCLTTARSSIVQVSYNVVDQIICYLRSSVGFLCTVDLLRLLIFKPFPTEFPSKYRNSFVKLAMQYC